MVGIHMKSRAEEAWTDCSGCYTAPQMCLSSRTAGRSAQAEKDPGATTVVLCRENILCPLNFSLIIISPKSEHDHFER